jgi:hypothetical protein
MECPRPLSVPLPLCCGKGEVRVTCGRGQAARWLLFFRNQHDARVRALSNWPNFYFRIRASFRSLFASLSSFLLKGLS